MASIIIKQENKYFNKLKKSIDVNSLTDEQSNRLSVELGIIHATKSSKTVYMAHCIANKLREEGYPFAIRGVLPNLFIFYLLGITKISPYDDRLKYVLPYQVAIGEISIPKPINDIDFSVPVCTRGEIVDYVLTEFQSDTDFYVYGLPGEDNELVGFKLVLFKKGDNPYNHGFSKYSTYPGLYDSGLPYITISGFDPTPIELKAATYWEKCLELNEPVNISNNHGYIPKVLKCREDIWKLIEKTDFSDSTKLWMYDHIRTGRDITQYDFLIEGLKEAAGDEWEEVRDDLENILYIFPITHAIEQFEYRKELLVH